MRHTYKIQKMQNTCVAYGCFDGVHRGHIAVIDALVKAGKNKGSQSVVISFCQNGEQREHSILTTEEEKSLFMEREGLDVLISYDAAWESGAAEAFIKEVLIKELGAETIVVGAHCQELEFLKTCGVCLVVVEAVRYKEAIITSDMVKKKIRESRFEEVATICGHPYILSGKVVHGKALGRTVGMPTANLRVPDRKLKPPSGVYATISYIQGGRHKGVTNIGTRPSVDDMSEITIETFLLDFVQDRYGEKQTVEVHWLIRGIQKFSSLKEVQNQVQKDASQVKVYLE